MLPSHPVTNQSAVVSPQIWAIGDMAAKSKKPSTVRRGPSSSEAPQITQHQNNRNSNPKIIATLSKGVGLLRLSNCQNQIIPAPTNHRPTKHDRR